MNPSGNNEYNKYVHKIIKRYRNLIKANILDIIMLYIQSFKIGVNLSGKYEYKLITANVIAVQVSWGPGQGFNGTEISLR